MTFRSNSSEHADKAVAQWNKATKMESNDAEPLIYIEDQSVLKDYTSFNRQYYDVIVLTMLTGSSDSVNIGRDNLQGFYAAQKEYNDQQNKTRYGPKLRLLIANVGSNAVSTQALRNVLVTIDKNNPVPGASGPIYFVGADGHASSDAQNKKVLVICVNTDGRGYPCG